MSCPCSVQAPEAVVDLIEPMDCTGSQLWDGLENSIEDPEEERVIFSALDSFAQYAKFAHFHCTHQRRQAFYALPREHWEMLAAPPFNYLETLDKVDEAIKSNAEIAQAILTNGLRSFHIGESAQPEQELRMPVKWAGSAKHGDVDKARSTIRQLYRDWSAEGAAERGACYGPVMRALADERAEREKKTKNDLFSEGMKVLVPGAGLGRLVFDLCYDGYETEGNEISYHQLIASSYILNVCPQAGQHRVFPWLHTFSNHTARAHHLRSYAIPDIHCGGALSQAQSRTGRPAGSMSMCAADFLCLYGDADHADTYDAVACVFFLDTAPNLVRYLLTMRHCLRPGGLLVNLGPLLWHFETSWPVGAHAQEDEGDAGTTGIADPGSFELCDDEVLAMVTKLGFEVVRHETGVRAPYIHDEGSMLQTVYKASFWVARKPWDAGDQGPGVDK